MQRRQDADMTASSQTLSLRLPPETKVRLERAASVTRRSRAFLVKEALERHLDTILNEHDRRCGAERLARLLAFKGAGVGEDGGRTMEDIDAQVRAFRGDE
jgi:predicted DNA-binding protein